MSTFAKNVQSYIDLISDEPLSSKKDSETGKKSKLTKISQIDKNYVESIFVDSNGRKPTSTKMNIGKLSKSLNFLNEHSKFDHSSRTPKNKEYNMLLTNNNREKVGLFNANHDSPIEEEVKNKAKRNV